MKANDNNKVHNPFVRGTRNLLKMMWEDIKTNFSIAKYALISSPKVGYREAGIGGWLLGAGYGAGIAATMIIITPFSVMYRWITGKNLLATVL